MSRKWKSQLKLWVSALGRIASRGWNHWKEMSLRLAEREHRDFGHRVLSPLEETKLRLAYWQAPR